MKRIIYKVQRQCCGNMYGSIICQPVHKEAGMDRDPEDRDPGDLISFGNESQGGFPVKPAQWPPMSLWICCAPTRQQGSEMNNILQTFNWYIYRQ